MNAGRYRDALIAIVSRWIEIARPDDSHRLGERPEACSLCRMVQGDDEQSLDLRVGALDEGRLAPK